MSPKEEPKKEKEEEKETITFNLEQCLPVKKISCCPNCRKTRCLTSQPNTPHVIECQECLKVFTIIEH